ncbi:MAG: hypothetical protein PHW83_12390 [Bacteroidales bacterium]|nr:hypothetical protein [Bacteroidales bacterium]
MLDAMKYYGKYKWIRIILIFILGLSYWIISKEIKPLNCIIPADYTAFKSVRDSIEELEGHKPKPIESLTIEELWLYYAINPCYLPLISDSALWEPGTKIGFKYSDLFNDSLSEGHSYSNRYLVGDFNVVDLKSNNRQTNEIYPKLESLTEFASFPPDLINQLDTIQYGTAEYDSLIAEIKIRLPESSWIFLNFIDKVWKYKMLPINREYSISWNTLYATGQSIVLCEACKDTLIMIGRFATSAKRLDIGNRYDAEGNIAEYYLESLPIGNRRRYYAGLNIITSKNWEWRRVYDSLDLKRDTEVGGGYRHIVMYRDKVELPNFLLITPSKNYPNAMVNNGIHEVALSDVARGMLGTANSLGCLRVSDFAAKFLRWWVPLNCKLFIAYNDTCYHKAIEYEGQIEDYLPFKTEKEGNEFRKWINTYHPLYAEILQIDTTGSHRNGYIIDGYFYFKNEYNEYRKTQKISQ